MAEQRKNWTILIYVCSTYVYFDFYFQGHLSSFDGVWIFWGNHFKASFLLSYTFSQLTKLNYALFQRDKGIPGSMSPQFLNKGMGQMVAGGNSSDHPSLKGRFPGPDHRKIRAAAKEKMLPGNSVSQVKKYCRVKQLVLEEHSFCQKCDLSRQGFFGDMFNCTEMKVFHFVSKDYCVSR